MLLRMMWVIMTLVTMLCSCKGNDPLNANGGALRLTLPFPSGEYWQLTQAYNGGSHVDWGFNYGDDRYALDFSQAGCEPYGKPVTPMAPGRVLRVFQDGVNDSGYGNSVLLDHGHGLVSRYAHLSQTLVNEGEWVTVDDRIGHVGNTGYVNGFACGSHPGTHLHVALYKDGRAIPPEPLSGQNHMEVGCWYSREGDRSCSGNPGDYNPSNNGDHGGASSFEITMTSVSPSEGLEDQTHFVWVAVIDSPENKPEVTLWIRNPLDAVNYPFTMSTDSEQSPWVFTYRKVLQDQADYPFWVEAESLGDQHFSNQETVTTHAWSGSAPEYSNFLQLPSDGEAGEDWFTWETRFTSYAPLSMTLKIVNPGDGVIYSFPMEADPYGSRDWIGSYQKTLRDQTVYPFWVEGSNVHGSETSPVYSVEAY